jgi:segregation and condensation protein A
MTDENIVDSQTQNKSTVSPVAIHDTATGIAVPENSPLIPDPQEKDKFQIQLENFQGPFDLLLHLIEEHKMDIYDVSISRITSAYLEYLTKVRQLDLEVAGEFLILAAALVELKSKMLLPKDGISDEELLAEIEAERLSILERLVEYKMFKNLARNLVTQEKEFHKIFNRGFINEQMVTAAEGEQEVLLKEVSLPDLLRAFARVWERAAAMQQRGGGEIFDDRYTVRDKMEEIVSRLHKGHAHFCFDDLFAKEFDKVEVITTFLAILELVRQAFITLVQQGVYGKIEIRACAVLPMEMMMVNEELVVDPEQKPEDSGQKPEDSGQKTEDSKQQTADSI